MPGRVLCGPIEICRMVCPAFCWHTSRDHLALQFASTNRVLKGGAYEIQAPHALRALLRYDFSLRPVLCNQSFRCFGCVKAPGFEDRKPSCIASIQRGLRSSNRGSFHISPNSKNFGYRARESNGCSGALPRPDFVYGRGPLPRRLAEPV